VNILMYNYVTKKLWVWELVVIIALIIFLSSCSTSSQAAQVDPTSEPPAATAAAKPTSTPEPSPTLEPTSTPTHSPTDTPVPTSTATPDLAATAAAAAAQIAAENLAAIKSELEQVGYPTDTGELGWIQDQPYEIVVDEYDSSYFETFANELVANNFILKTDITWESSSGLAGCGLFFRSEPNFKQGAQYELAFLRLSGLPAWEIAYRKDNEFKKSVTRILTAGAIEQEQGSTNSYMLIAEEGKFTLYINDLRIGSYYDYSNSLLEGKFAFTGWQESGKTSCEFNNTWVWLLD